MELCGGEPWLPGGPTLPKLLLPSESPGTLRQHRHYLAGLVSGLPLRVLGGTPATSPGGCWGSGLLSLPLPAGAQLSSQFHCLWHGSNAGLSDRVSLHARAKVSCLSPSPLNSRPWWGHGRHRERSLESHQLHNMQELASEKVQLGVAG